MAGLTPGPEDAEKQDNGAGNLASSTHSRNTIPANVPHEARRMSSAGKCPGFWSATNELGAAWRVGRNAIGMIMSNTCPNGASQRRPRW